MRCTCLRWLVLAGCVLLLNAQPVYAQLARASAANSTIYTMQRADTTHADSSGIVHRMYESIQAVYKFVRRVADPLLHFFERLWHSMTKDRTDHDSILRFPLGGRKS